MSIPKFLRDGPHVWRTDPLQDSHTTYEEGGSKGKGAKITVHRSDGLALHGAKGRCQLTLVVSVGFVAFEE